MYARDWLIRSWATPRITVSPAGWPCVSLTSLKWSMSTMANDSGSPVRLVRLISSSSRSVTYRRLKAPVRWSFSECSASWTLRMATAA
ncbi:MAG: hypothetical protein DMD78_28895 [Candidatus Rokuibacteriota bacterium]|nr:MAG: hypothetical protein DMD78_28895 [Candidatus Rokubacteria bacterium]